MNTAVWLIQKKTIDNLTSNISFKGPILNVFEAVGRAYVLCMLVQDSCCTKKDFETKHEHEFGPEVRGGCQQGK